MKIDSSSIQMQAQRQYQERQREELHMRTGEERPRDNTPQTSTRPIIDRGAIPAVPAQNNGPGVAATPATPAIPPGRQFQILDDNGNLKWPTDGVRMELSAEARASLPVRLEVDSEQLQTASMSSEDSMKMQLLSALYTQITGKTMEIIDTAELMGQVSNIEAPHSQSPANGSPAEASGSSGLSFDYYASHFESEKTTFAAEGVIQTSDGKQIEFSVNLSMSREYFSETSLSVRDGKAVVKDPLVINFSGQAAELTQSKFAFDLDSDGREEQISFVTPGSGFLAADFNGDNKVNDGSELFGPSSGNGFAELAKHDDDGNGWIDEGDAIYDKLRIWSKDVDGQDQLVALGSKDVGAIYLGNIATEFSHKSITNQLQGEVVSTGIYLGEEGNVGTVQQINLVV